MITICFLCHGNICRSVMAEYIFKQIVKKNSKDDMFCIFSRATSLEEIGNDIYPPVKDILRKNGVPFSQHFAKRITLEEMLNSDYVFVMDENNIHYLQMLFGEEIAKKAIKFNSLLGLNTDISDPWYDGQFEKVFQEISICSKALFNKIIK